MTDEEGISQEVIDALIREMRGLDAIPLLAGLAGLALLPSNAGRQFRLEALAEVAASRSEHAGERPPRPRDFRRIANSTSVLTVVGSIEDPPEMPVTEPIFFEGQCYVAFSGQGTEVVANTERLLEVFAAEELDSPQASPGARELILAVLRLSSAVAGRAGISAGAALEPGTDVIVPDDVAPLAAAVTWSQSDLASALSGAEGALERLSVPLGDATPNLLPHRGALVRRPVVRLPDGAVVVLPGLLMPALTHALLAMTFAAGQIQTVARGFAESCHRHADRSLTYVAVTRVPDRPPTSLPPTVIEQLYAMDERTAMVLMTVTSSLASFDPDGHESWWAAGDDPGQDALEDRIRELVSWASGVGDGYDEVFVLLAFAAPAGFGVTLGLRELGITAEVLPVSPASLEVMAYQERGNALGLLRFSKSLSQLEAKTHLIGWNVLDQYAAYKRHKDSFYMSDGRAPTAIWFTSDYGLELRQQLLNDLRPQSAPGANGDPTPVIARYREGAPIFVPRDPYRQSIRLVRLERTDVWLVGEPWSGLPAGAADLYEHLVEAAAYWVWQVGPMVVAGVTKDRPQITIYVEIEDHAAWMASDIPDIPPSLDDTGLRTSDREAAASLLLRPGLRSALHRPDNVGERRLAIELANALAILLTDRGIASEVGERLLRDVAPLGQRKMILLLAPENALDVGPPDDLPQWSKVSDWHVERLLDDLATALAGAGYRTGPVGDSRAQNELLKFTVGFCFERLRAAVAQLSADGLIDKLMSQYEALLRETALHRLQIPTRIACFGEYSDFAAMLRQEEHDLTEAAIALRFVIEYAAARPPDGTRILSNEHYDELLAIASRITDFGRLSDVVHFDLAEVNARVLESGRLGLRPDVLDRGMQAWLNLAIPAQIREAQESFGSHWRTLTGSGPPPEVERAFSAEFGLSMSEMGALTAELTNVATAAGQAVVTRRRADLVPDLADRLGWSVTTVNAALESLSSAPRADFVTPPAGYESYDIYPWRFNRRLSILRRPIIATDRDGVPHLTWGRRAVYTAFHYTGSLAFTARLKATTSEMKSFISTLTAEAGLDLQHRVAGIARGRSMATRERVTKVGPHRLIDEDGDLGDIDVLAADPATRIVWSIECKNLVAARTPWELQHEINDLHDPASGIVARHARRAAWAQAHLAEIVAWLALPSGSWRVESLIVTSSELVGPHLRAAAMPVLDVEALEQHFAAARVRPVSSGGKGSWKKSKGWKKGKRSKRR